MPRCKKNRRCRKLDGNRMFKPAGIPGHELEEINIDLDEFEAIRPCKHDDKHQIQASEMMEVSRATVQRLLQSGRKKIVDALLHNKVIIIECEDKKEV